MEAAEVLQGSSYPHGCCTLSGDRICGYWRSHVALQVIWGECIAGALYINDFCDIAKQAGFADPRILHQGPVAINDKDIQVRRWLVLLLTPHVFNRRLSSVAMIYGVIANVKSHP